MEINVLGLSGSILLLLNRIRGRTRSFFWCHRVETSWYSSRELWRNIGSVYPTRVAKSGTMAMRAVLITLSVVFAAKASLWMRYWVGARWRCGKEALLPGQSLEPVGSSQVRQELRFSLLLIPLVLIIWWVGFAVLTSSLYWC